MNVSLAKKLLVAAALASFVVAVVGYVPLSIGQEKPEAKKEEGKAKGRLPAYYGDVVTEEQRGKIYEIQSKYQKQINALNEQLLDLVKKQNAEIEAVLSAEQKAKVEAARTAAADKKKKKAEDEKKPETK